MKQKKGAAGVALTIFLAMAGSASGQATAPDRDAAATLAAVKDVCLPLLMGQTMQTVAKTTGLKAGRDDSWVLTVEGKRRVEISPPGGSNPHVCAATIIHDPNAGDAIVAALSTWAAGQSPALQSLKTKEKATGALYQLTTSSWYGKVGPSDLALVYSEDRTLAGKAVQGPLDQATLTVGLTPTAS